MLLLTAVVSQLGILAQSNPWLCLTSVTWPIPGQANNLAQIKSIFLKYLFNIYLEEQQCGEEEKPRLPRFSFIT